MTHPTFEFITHGERLAIARLSPTAAVPTWATGGFVTISRTAHELSIVCPQHLVPAAVQQERDKVAFGIQGIVPMTTIGILAALCGTLAAAEVPVFVISTFDTDYLLVAAATFTVARSALEAQGHRFTGDLPA